MDAATARLRAEDLSPGDQRFADLDWSELVLEVIDRPDHPSLAEAYARLGREFGSRNELETLAVLEKRLGWRPDVPTPSGLHLAYELLVVRRAGRLVAVRDHSAIVRGPLHSAAAPPQADTADGPTRVAERPALVHLSHVLVEPELRGSGLAGWLRALPLGLARRCALAAKNMTDAVVLLAEMEPFDPTDTASLRRLRAYERAGFRKVEPAAVEFCQPDFRPPATIAADTPRPVRLDLILRRVGREAEASIPARELAHLLDALYGMYAESLERDHVSALAAAARARCSRHATLGLIAPTA